MNDEKGMVLSMVLAAMAVGALLVGPFLMQASTSLISSRNYGESISEQSAADAGVEHAIWDLVYDDLANEFSSPGDSFNYQLSESINGKNPIIAARLDSIDTVSGSPNYENFSEAKEGWFINCDSITIGTPLGTQEGDLLIAAVVTDRDTSASLAPPEGEGWTQIDLSQQHGDVTMGVWWKLAESSESSNHQFAWSESVEVQAYGWIMRFTGHDVNNPINTVATYGGSGDLYPDSPSVTTTVANTLILRIGGFDNGSIIHNVTGLGGHEIITMDESSGWEWFNCSGGAGYVAQPTIGDSPTVDFDLLWWNDYRTVTIAIAPEDGDDSATYDIVSVASGCTITAAVTITGQTATVNSWQVE